MAETRRAPPFLSPLYPILDASLETEASSLEALAAFARAGVTLVQLRAKDRSSGDLYEWALAARRAAKGTAVRIVVNDRVDVALLTGSAGVHLGQGDVSSESARRLLGERAVIGLSTHSVEQARVAREAPVDYIAIGPIFATSTKRDAEPVLGIEGARAVREVVDKPLVAIGGITMETAAALFEAGIDAVAVISALRKPLEEGETLETRAKKWMALAGC